MLNRNFRLPVLLSLLLLGCGTDGDGETTQGNETDSAVNDTSSEFSEDDDTETGEVPDTEALNPCVESFQQATVLRDPEYNSQYVTQITVSADTIYYGFINEGIYRMGSGTLSPELLIETAGATPRVLAYGNYIYWLSEEEGNLYRFPADAVDGQSELLLEAYEGTVFSNRFAVDAQGYIYFEYSKNANYAVARRLIGTNDAPEELDFISNPQRIALDGDTLYIAWGGPFRGEISALSTTDLTENVLVEGDEILSFAYRDGQIAYASARTNPALLDVETMAHVELLASEQELESLVFFNDRLYWNTREYIGWSNLDGSYCELVYEMTDDQWMGLKDLTVTDAGILFAFTSIMDNGFYFVPHP